MSPESSNGDSSGTLSVTLVRSIHGRLKSHQASVRGLGLRRMHQTVQVRDTPENRGMINAAVHMLRVEEPAGASSGAPAGASSQGQGS